MKKHPIILNALLIIAIAVIGVVIASLSLSLFTKHGQYKTVPAVENMSYTDAINKLNDAGFKVQISDSVYRADVKPGYVLEQTPAADSNVKPGRVVYLIINAVSPKKVALTNMQGVSLRQAKAMLEGFGFKNIKVSYKLGKHRDIVLNLKVDGRTVRTGQKVPVNSVIVIEVSDGRVDELADSLLNSEYGSTPPYGGYGEGEYEGGYEGDPYGPNGASETDDDIDPYGGRDPRAPTSNN